MNKMILCTVGTSISNQCQSQRSLLAQKSNWDDPTDYFETEIKNRIAGFKDTEFRKISAEINSIDRLNITSNDKIVLLSSDNAPGKACSNCLRNLIHSHYDIPYDNIIIERIEGLQVYDSQLLKQVGLKNFISKSLKYIADKTLAYQYDIIINPTGGFKGVLPFLTILGMLYGKKTIYIFEFSDELIYLPPLPFTFDLRIFNRVRPALKFIDEKVAVSEREYLSKVINFIESERELFLSFVEPFDAHTITISSLAHSLLAIETNALHSMVLKEVADDLKNDTSKPALAVKRLIERSSSPLWRNAHSENWVTTDLIVLKQSKTAERIAGFIKNDTFYITHAFKNHDDYELKLKNNFAKDYYHADFVEYAICEEEIGISDDDDDRSLIDERDSLLIQNQQLQNRLKTAQAAGAIQIKELETIRQEYKELYAEMEKIRIELTAAQEYVTELEKAASSQRKSLKKHGIWHTIKNLFGKPQ